ncbi:DNA alkylation repair protein [Thiospirochaeta perfilievii]|uniref:DNA alkylation repair protein n=1 Tax=Thiospirochaeta perfilievii TaxID=252967 RepID=A0A5C1QEQ9_9SPIO|nr:DNA alkylation repair protein [Thiospirochaeta perfilievii]QEN05499.1 DNA alkylation repair protein [Thiospirochaeta perfilievii]
MLQKLKNELINKANEDRKIKMLRYFKTGKGEYGEGDIFLGISNPHIRSSIKPYITTLTIDEISELLRSKEHEFRLAALIIMVERYRRKSGDRELIVDLYINSTEYVNNWDLVDCSAHYILGPWLESREKSILYEFANSGNIWKQRIAIMSTFHFIKKNREFKDTFDIADILLTHKEDLIHKAVGWMIREVGNISIIEEEKFLKNRYNKMPRTMLRYAIEKFPRDKRTEYLKGRI